jgi:hypothetical protein
MSGKQDNNIRFDDLHNLMLRLGFNIRNKGTSHHYITMKGVQERINIQPDDNGKAINYQVRQCRKVIHKYVLGGDR